VLSLYQARWDSQTATISDPTLRRELQTGLSDNLAYYPEFLDLARFGDAGYEAAVMNFLRAKYEGRKFDLILAMGEHTRDFVARFRDDALFAGTPLVYSAATRSSAVANASGLIAPPNLKTALDTALGIQPDTEHVFVVSGSSGLDRDYERLAREQFKPLEARRAFTYLTGLPIRDLLRQVSALPPRSLIFFTTLLADGQGQRFLPFETLDRINAAASAPIYSWNANAMGHGIVGGRLADNDVLDRQIAAVALRVLQGEKADAIAVTEIDWSVTEFDSRQLKRWGLSTASLPAGSTVLYPQPGVWGQYGSYILLGSLLLVLQTAFIAALLLQRSRRLRVERALRESEERFHLMADTAPVMIWTVGTDKRCDFVNRRWLEFTGRTMEQERGNGWTDNILLHDRDACWQTYTVAFDARDRFQMEYRLRRADGEYRWILDTGVPRYAPDGTFAGYIGSCIDLTERNVAEEALRHQQQRYELAAAAGSVGVWDWHLATNDLYVDPSLKSMLGLQDGEISHRPEDWRSRVHPQDAAALTAQLQLCTDGHIDAYEIEHRMLHKNGSVRWFLSRGTLMRDATGAPLRIVGADVDITDRKRSDDLFHLAIEAAPAGMLMIDGAGTIALVNAQVEKLFGYRRDELIGKPVDLLIPERFRRQPDEGPRDFPDRATARFMDSDRDLCGVRKNGHEVPIEIGLNPIEMPQGSFVIASIADITDRKQAEREKESLVDHLQDLAGRLIAAQELERARLARDLHDDTSQQLAVLSMSLSALKRRLAGLEGGADLLRDMATVQERTAALTENVRHLSHDLHPSVIEHAGLVATLARYCDELSRQKSVSLTFDAPPDFGVIDAAAALCLYRVAQEALRNIVWHAQARHATVRLGRAGDAAELTITDDGRGFDAVKAHKSRRGLGLVSISERVKLAGGTASIVTELGKGTQVRVQVPANARV
jgi:PAS domain S-box-containing protein